MPVDIGLNDDARNTSADALRVLLAETYALYSKTHGYHWNVTGPRFNALHTMFETQYNELWLALDEIAERIRALGEQLEAERARCAKLIADNEASLLALRDLLLEKKVLDARALAELG